MNLKQFHSTCINHTQRLFNERKQLPATLFALKPDGDVRLLVRQFDGDDDKEFTYNMYAMILVAEQCSMYCFTSEAWFSSHEALADDNIKDFDINSVPRPMDDPNRKEGVFVITTAIDDTQLMHMFEIKTKNDQKYLSDQSSSDDTKSLRDNLRLFHRLPREKVKLEPQLLNELLGLSKPSWYMTIKKENFNKVKVDA